MRPETRKLQLRMRKEEFDNKRRFVAVEADYFRGRDIFRSNTLHASEFSIVPQRCMVRSEFKSQIHGDQFDSAEPHRDRVRLPSRGQAEPTRMAVLLKAVA